LYKRYLHTTIADFRPQTSDCGLRNHPSLHPAPSTSKKARSGSRGPATTLDQLGPLEDPDPSGPARRSRNRSHPSPTGREALPGRWAQPRARSFAVVNPGFTITQHFQLSTSNSALSTLNSALSTSNSALSTSNSALSSRTSDQGLRRGTAKSSCTAYPFCPCSR
jgi:hypothetical protein